MIDVIIYCRVSTDEQGDNGLGLEAQEFACREWCERNGAIARLVFHETLKGATPLSERVVFMEAASELRRDSVLLVAKRDRLSRGDAFEVAVIERAVRSRKARVLSVAGEGTADDSPASMLMRRIMDALSEYERLLIGVRTRAALQAKRRRGEVAGNVPYGFTLARDRKTLVLDQEQQLVLQAIHILHDCGFSIRGIAEQLHEWDIKPRGKSKRWSTGTLQGLLKVNRQTQTVS